MSALLAADALELAYGDTPACRDLSFHIEEGEIVALIGGNGAGKSTTLRAIAGVLRPRAGTIRTINAGGTSVLLVEQNARYALETARRGYVLQTGAIVASGPCAALREDERVRHAYLGAGASAAKGA